MIVFYMIYRDGGQQPPSFIHDTIDGAKSEAQRLAIKHPGSKFYIMKAISSCVKNEISWEEI
jgi:hypothetical protein